MRARFDPDGWPQSAIEIWFSSSTEPKWHAGLSEMESENEFCSESERISLIIVGESLSQRGESDRILLLSALEDCFKGATDARVLRGAVDEGKPRIRRLRISKPLSEDGVSRHLKPYWFSCLRHKRFNMTSHRCPCRQAEATLREMLPVIDAPMLTPSATTFCRGSVGMSGF